MLVVNGIASYHSTTDSGLVYRFGGLPGPVGTYTVQDYAYRFENFFHPFVG